MNNTSVWTFIEFFFSLITFVLNLQRYCTICKKHFVLFIWHVRFSFFKTLNFKKLLKAIMNSSQTAFSRYLPLISMGQIGKLTNSSESGSIKYFWSLLKNSFQPVCLMIIYRVGKILMASDGKPKDCLFNYCYINLKFFCKCLKIPPFIFYKYRMQTFILFILNSHHLRKKFIFS